MVARVVGQRQAIARAFEEELAGGLTADERATLENLMARMRANLAAMDAARPNVGRAS